MLHVFETTEAVLDATARFFVKIATESVKERGEFTVALSGGSSPKGLYELLASPAFSQQVEWNKVYFFFGDERYVPANDPQNNALMVQKALFTPLGIREDHIFAVNTSLPPAEAADEYEKAVNNHFGPGKTRFDLILLGLGDNSHTASLFPYTPVLHEKDAGIRAVFLQDQQVYRITMTAPLINQARNIAFLVYGISKAEAVQHVLEGGQDIEQYPAQLIHPGAGEVHWFMDEAAGIRIKKA